MTNLKYLSDTYLYESEAIFLEEKENEKGKALILDETIFYPQGGGQPSDKGVIMNNISNDSENKDYGHFYDSEINSEGHCPEGQNNVIFNVNDVRLDENGVVWHFGEYEKGEFKKGDKVKLKIDSERRSLNAKLHSAGHLIDCAVTKIGVKNFKPTKGYHFSDGPYVEYDGIIENKEEFLENLQKTIDELVEKNLNHQVEDLSFEEAQKRGIYTPPGKSARISSFEGFEGYGCGGTHINSTKEIGKITIKKIKSKQGKTKIAYSIE